MHKLIQEPVPVLIIGDRLRCLRRIESSQDGQATTTLLVGIAVEDSGAPSLRDSVRKHLPAIEEACSRQRFDHVVLVASCPHWFESRTRGAKPLAVEIYEDLERSQASYAPIYLVLVTDRTDPGLLKARLTDLARSRPSVASAVILHEEDLAGSSISDAAVAEFL